MLPLQTTHLFLVSGRDHKECDVKVIRFFNKTTLVRYDRVEIIEKKSIPASDPAFFEKLDAATARNMEVITSFMDELEESGIDRLRDFLAVTEGYQSKTFHTIAHLLDGFFGIDSFFYNLEDDSHHVSNTLRKRIGQDPSRFFLIEAQGSSSSTETASFLHSPDKKRV